MKNRLMKLGLWVAFIALAAGCGGAEGYKKVTAGPMPAMGNWDGVYYSEAYGRMELTDNGNGTVVGLYEGDRYHGKIEGVPEGDLLNFKWTQWDEDLNGKSRETTGHGYFRYVVKEEGTAQKSRLTAYAEGEWGYLEANSGHPWVAVRFPDGTKKILNLQNKETGEKTSTANPFEGGGASSSSSDASSSDGGSLDSSSGSSSGSGGGGLESDVSDLF